MSEQIIHYTNSSGLKGIIEDKCLWATHYKFLNDSQELTYFFQNTAKEIIQDGIVKGSIIPDDNELKTILEEKVTTLAEEMKNSTVEVANLYITSFSKPFSYDQKDSLSHWRGYSNPDGYAVVFNLKCITELIEKEIKDGRFLRAFLSDVHYKGKEKSQNRLQSENLLKEFITNPNIAMDPEKNFFDHIFMLACAEKHPAFTDEREVRILAIHNENIETGEISNSSQKDTATEIYFRNPNGIQTPYTKLFKSREKDFLNSIEEIIIHPSENFNKRRIGLEFFLRKHSISPKVSCSNIPFVSHR